MIRRFQCVVMPVLLTVSVLVGAAGCNFLAEVDRVCVTPIAGYDVFGLLIDAETSNPLVGVAVEIQLEGTDGLIGFPAFALSEERGQLLHDPNATLEHGVTGIFSQVVVTDIAEEQCFSRQSLLAAVRAGEIPEAEPEFVADYSDLELPPAVVRAHLTLHLEDQIMELTIEVKEELVSCPADKADQPCDLSLGTILISLE